VFGQSDVIGEGTGYGGRFTFQGSSSFNGVDVFLASGGTNNYGHFRGFTVALAAGGVVSTAVGEVSGYGDNSLFESLAFVNIGGYSSNVPKVLWVHGTPGGSTSSCCNMTLRNVEADGQDGAGGTTGTIPCVIGGTASGDMTDYVVFDNLNCLHPGKAMNNLILQGYTGDTINLHFVGQLYMETGNQTAPPDTTTPAVLIKSGVDGVDFDSVMLGIDTTGSTRRIIDNESQTPVRAHSIFGFTTPNCLYDSSFAFTATAFQGVGSCNFVAYDGFSSYQANAVVTAYQAIAIATSGSGPEPSYGPDFWGFWWNTSIGPALNKFGHIYGAPTASNVSSTVPVGRVTIQAAASGGTLTDVLSAWGDGTLRNGTNAVLPWAQLTGYNGNSSGVKIPLALGWTDPTMVEPLCHDANGNVTDNPATCPTVADVTFTVANSTTINANSCSPAAGSSGTSVTMSGLTSSMTVSVTATTDTSNVTGWGNPAAGVLYILVAPGSGAFTYHVCNNTSSNITSGASVTFNTSAK
jgi:hypothetical protein